MTNGSEADQRASDQGGSPDDREIDTSVARLVLGAERVTEAPFYSTNIAEAWSLVYEMRFVHRWRVTLDVGPSLVHVTVTREDGRTFSATAGMTPAAIASAYLAARTTE